MPPINVKQFNRKKTVQTSPIPGTNQIKNSAGGYVWEVDDWAKLDRFLILGTDGGTFYISEQDLLKQNHDAVVKCIKADGIRALNRIVDVSFEGKAAKNDPAIFALALVFVHGSPEVKAAAEEALPKVCRIGTHLFHFAQYVSAMRGWGRGLRRAVAKWYTGKKPDALALQVIKYQQRDKWSNRDLLRLAHPVAPSKEHDSIFRWIISGKDGLGKRVVNKDKKEFNYKKVNDLHPLIEAFEEAKVATHKTEIIQLISKYNLPREAIPTQFLNEPEVWEALLPEMGMTAMLRNLGKMTAINLISPLSKTSKFIVESFLDQEKLKKSRLHPLVILNAMKVYAQGRGDKGSLAWTPNQRIVDALNDAFYLSFGNVTPTGKNLMLALDVSGSMGCGAISGMSLSCREASAALALVTANVEKNYYIMGFSNRFIPLAISPKMRLDAVCRYMGSLPFESTDCSLPMTYAIDNKLDVDGFSVYTDNETYAGKIHPAQALKNYRNKFNENSKSVVIGMAANPFTIADPNDRGMMDVVGFSTEVPNVISDFFVS